MRTNIDLDGRLLARARKLTGLPTKRAIVHRALEVLVAAEERKSVLRYYASGIWRGDLKEMRREAD